jgi:hypothetical protein
MQLSADDQRNLRDAASDAWKQSGGKYLCSAMLFRNDSRVTQIAKLDPMTIIFLLQMAYKLWQWWRANKISDPSDFLTNAIMLLGNEPRFGGSE